MKPNEIFSKEALIKLRSPERLDILLPITTPLNWMSLIAVAVLIFAVVLWSIFGAFTLKADGMGLIMDSAGVVNASHVAGGKLTRLYVHSGDTVHRGDVIAYIEQTGEVDSRLSQHNITLAQNDRDVESRVTERDAKAYSRKAVEKVISDYDGIVDDVMVAEGSVVNAGAPLVSIRRGGAETLTGVLYIPVDMGKRVEPGMTIQLAPNGVDTSETGSLLGVVRSVSQYPTTAEAMQKKLANTQLVSMITQTQKGAAVEIGFDLVTDKDSESGYLWTSNVGKSQKVSAGSFCTGSIIIERTPPIEKVFYRLSQWLRNR